MVLAPDRLSDAQRLHQRIERAFLAAAQADTELAKLLAECWDTRAYRELGFSLKGDYCASFGLSYEKARYLVRLARKFREVPSLEEAMRSGVSWTKLREVEKVVVPETAEAWLELARTRPQREVARAVQCSEVGQAPPAAGELRREARERLVFEVTVAQAQLIRAMLEKQRDLAGVSVEDFDAGAVLAALARAELDDDVPDGETLPLPTGVIAVCHCPGCGACFHPDHHVDEPGMDQVLEDPLVVDLVQNEQSARVVDQVMGRPIGTGRPSGALRAAVPKAVRLRTFIRDGLRCRVPGCGGRRYLQLHHIQHVKDFGQNTTHNLIWLCSAHHAMHHSGRLGIAGDADGPVVFDLPDGRARESLPRVAGATSTRAASLGAGDHRTALPDGGRESGPSRGCSAPPRASPG